MLHYSVPSGATRRQFLVNILLDVMVQDTGFTVSLRFTGDLARFGGHQKKKCDYSNESNLAVLFLFCGTVYYAVQGGSSFRVSR